MKKSVLMAMVSLLIGLAGERCQAADIGEPPHSSGTPTAGDTAPPDVTSGVIASPAGVGTSSTYQYDFSVPGKVTVIMGSTFQTYLREEGEPLTFDHIVNSGIVNEDGTREIVDSH